MRYLIIVAALAVAGCDEPPPGAEEHISTMTYIVRTVEVKGHEYIIFDGSYKGVFGYWFEFDGSVSFKDPKGDTLPFAYGKTIDECRKMMGKHNRACK